MKRLILVIEQDPPLAASQLQTVMMFLGNAFGSNVDIEVDSESNVVNCRGALLLRATGKPVPPKSSTK